MRLDTTMTQRMDQRMLLAPRMIQSMEILQLPIMALQERIQQELQENPVLELKEVSNDETTVDGEAATSPETETEEPASQETELVIDEAGDNELDFERFEAMSRDLEDRYSEEHRPSRGGLDEEGDKKHDAMQNMPSRPQSLQDYLNEQLSFLDATADQLRLIRFLITHIDEKGFLTVNTEDIARNYDQPVTLVQVEEALRAVQKLEPAGVGARDLKECLLLQLTPEMPYREAMRVLILNHLDDLEHNRLPIIQRRTGFDLATINKAREALKHLSLRPGARFTTDNIPYVVPDIAVERREDGEYEVRLLDDWTPSIYSAAATWKCTGTRAPVPKPKNS